MKILSPLQNSAYLNTIQRKPVITQQFGKDFLLNGKLYYQSLGMQGHNGIDFRAKVGIPVFASMSGVITTCNDGSKGYGLHLKLRSEINAVELVYAHLSKILVRNGSKVEMGEIIAFSGNSGITTAAHLHFGLRELSKSGENVWNWKVKNYGNGYLGYLDIESEILTWRGSLNAKEITL